MINDYLIDELTNTTFDQWMCPIYTAEDLDLIDGEFCNSTVDEILCWPPTPINTYAVQPCSFTLNSVTYDKNANSSRFCHENGTWAQVANYSNCKPASSKNENLDDLSIVRGATIIYKFGYSLSLFAVTIAVIIFIVFKDLRCLRNTIHMNLFLTYILFDVTWIIKLSFGETLTNLKGSCEISVLLVYLLLTNFFWMFVEGLYLYLLVARTFSVEKIKFRTYFVIGWVAPAVLTSIWVLLKIYHVKLPKQLKNYHNCLYDINHNYDYFYKIPIIILLIINVYFLCRILYILITKLRTRMASIDESKQYQKAAKALLVLIPLLGLTYLLVLVQPKDKKAASVFQIAQAALLSTQGFTVSIMYCFLNGEVRNAVCHRYQRWKMNREMYGRQKTRSNNWDVPRYSRTESIRLVNTPSIIITTPGKNDNTDAREDEIANQWIAAAAANKPVEENDDQLPSTTYCIVQNETKSTQKLNSNDDYSKMSIIKLNIDNCTHDNMIDLDVNLTETY